MSYFTETFESILEFKGDAEASYAVRRASEKVSGDHSVGKIAATASKAYNADGPDKATNSKEYIRRKNESNKTRRMASTIASNKDATNMAKSSLKYYGGKSERDRKEMDAISKLNNRGITSQNGHDSLKRVKREGYDPVYEDLCRMGIID